MALCGLLLVRSAALLGVETDDDGGTMGVAGSDDRLNGRAESKENNKLLAYFLKVQIMISTYLISSTSHSVGNLK